MANSTFDMSSAWHRFWSEVYYTNMSNEYYHNPYWPGVSELERLYGENVESVYWAFTTGYGLWFTCFPISVLYVAVIFSIRAWMTNRPRYELRWPLALWNAHLAVFSLVGTLRGAPEMIDLFVSHGLRKGLYESACTSRFAFGDVGIWSWLFMLSKAYEMGDTVFIVLRKQKLIFLHWYHHIATMVYVFYCYADQQAAARWFYVMNFAVHTIMYSYFSLKALRVRVPRAVSMVITGLQLTQMFAAAYVCCLVLYYKRHGVPCDASYFGMYACLTMYSSYCVLFAHFFYRSYVRSHQQHEVAATDTKVQHAHRRQRHHIKQS